eukprot:CAMPEP_0114661732 /NCGR_PEP_ID=MMETSP0191-20121206/23202_1 /TAXON_ID=126664 /ORGANISM="Sorites sp." /LENGTH=149 /DNA_ID=CAMNT_0001895369 /DNA_START=1040 /DNA_END=1489 /DNA_ORIENTATION=+
MAHQIAFLIDQCGKDQNAMASGRKCWGELGKDLANKEDIEKHVAKFVRIAQQMARDEVEAGKLRKQEDAIEAVIHTKAAELKTVVEQESKALKDEAEHATELKDKSEEKVKEAQANQQAAQLTDEASKAIDTLKSPMRQERPETKGPET